MSITGNQVVVVKRICPPKSLKRSTMTTVQTTLLMGSFQVNVKRPMFDLEDELRKRILTEQRRRFYT